MTSANSISGAPFSSRVNNSATASWIWDAGVPSPRNAWRRFRRTFATHHTVESASLTITADSRYVAFVNGVRVGYGPVRGFPHRWFIDTWEIGHLLHPDAPNTIAVHVLHFGLSTFADHRKRGGLLAQIAINDEFETRNIGTDGTWLVETPFGHDPRANRLSCQLGFTEQFDNRHDDGDWTLPGYDDSAWSAATVIAAPGDGPWTKLVPRDIPPLEERVVRPGSLSRLAFVRPTPISAAIDLRVQLSPESTDHANHVAYTGYLLTTLRLARDATVTMTLPGPSFRDLGINVGGRWFPRAALADGAQDSHSLTVDLEAGDHLVAIDISGRDHGHTFSLLLDADDPGAVSLATPLGDADAGTPFVTVGPLTGVAIGRVEKIFPEVPPIPEDIAARMQSLGDPSRLAEFGERVRPVPAALVSPVSLYGLAVHPAERVEIPVPAAMQAIAAGNAIEIPVRPARDTELIFDLGREFSGFMTVEVEAPAGTVVDLYGFEYLKGDHREDTSGLDNSLRYIARDGRQRYTSPTRRGLRWLQVTIRNAVPGARIHLHDVAVIESHFPVSRSGSFRSSDARLNEIWEMSRRTVIACMEDTYVDCPAYEQVFWVGDSYSSSRFAAYLFGAEALTERCLRLVPESA
ncbi:MAG TPA: family 78 glycoside hydrolase catalytic domain, partial [Thermomicrobiales bacterium]|nr:family 78 glycoside hydrolase catalytic domain [Thermomicrobiales bacterium]